MMLVYLARQFTFDVVNHVAYSRSPNKAVKLKEDIARNLGIGNSTGLGMAPFIVNHPALLNQWIIAKEKALKSIRSISSVSQKDKDIFQSYLSIIRENIKFWKTESYFQKKKNKQLLKDLSIFQKFYSTFPLNKFFWNSIYEWTEANTQSECCEFIISLMMEVYPDIVEPLSFEMSINEDEYFDIDTSRTIKEVCELIEDQYTWLLDINFDDKENILNFWYYSKNKQEPRMSDRFTEEGSDLELPLAIARDVSALYDDLKSCNLEEPRVLFVKKPRIPSHIKKSINMRETSYSEIQDNTISKTLIPVDMLRLKLSFLVQLALTSF